MSRAVDAAPLARYGFRAPAKVAADLPEDWATDDRWTTVLALLGGTADPDAGWRRLQRLGEAVRHRVYGRPDRAAALLRIVGFSDYLTDLLSRTPGLPGELLGDPRAERTDVAGLRNAGIVDIAASDLASAPDRESLCATTRSLTALADECLHRVLDEEGSEVRLAVMAMGKWGAEELNYVSDIDVLFVAPDGGSTDEAERVAQRVIEVMSGPPVIFRVDADLRPEGRNGALVRTIDAYRTYYDRWAHVWEFQSLIKCRPAAGDEALGAEFMELIQPYVWPEKLSPDAVQQIRALKARAEQEIVRRGLRSRRRGRGGVGGLPAQEGEAAGGLPPQREVKLGRGGIRDVEFALQLLQLVHGRHHTQLRVRSTLDALDIMGAEGFVAEDDVRALEDAYVFLRHVEHRLQVESGRQTHTVPSSERKREHLARSLGFREGSATTALEAFEEAWSATTNVVRTIHERLFYRPLMETFASTPSLRATMSDEEADDRFAALGFDRPPRVREAIAKMTAGSSRRAKVMRAVLPGVLAWMAETPDADAGMERLADLSHGFDALPHLLAVLRDEPPVVELLCRVLGTGPVLSGLLSRDPSLITALGEQHEQDVRAHAVSVVRRAGSELEAANSLRRFKDAEQLRLAARDLGAGADPEVFVEVAAELSDVGDACLDAAIDYARSVEAARTDGPPPGSFAVIGMGRYGGRELNHASDLDVMFVYDQDSACPDGTDARLFHSAVAERVIALLASTPPIFKVDAELRPEGRSGPLVRTFQSYLVYYERWASLWEFQALTRARPCAGDRALGRLLIDSVASKVWRPSLTAEEVGEIRKMKARIERERVSTREDARYQVKLGVGGLADVEFTVQLQQMRYGRSYPELRTPSTYKAIGSLEALGLLDEQDAGWLRDAYLLLNRVRNHMFLLRGLATDALPTRDEEVERLAQSLGYGLLSRSRFLERYKRTTRRARRVTDRLFYGKEA